MIRKLLTVLVILVCSVFVMAQTLGTTYYWQEVFSVTTSATDTTFSTPYQNCVIYSDTLDIDIKIGAPDTSNVTSQSYIRLQAGRSLYFAPPLTVKRLIVKTVDGTGNIFVIGNKKASQF